MQVERTSYKKHLGILLHEKLNFKKHIDSVLPKINKVISVIRKLRHSLPRKSLLTIYKAFLKFFLNPLIDYGESFCEKLEPVQDKAALAITGAMKGGSRDEVYHQE